MMQFLSNQGPWAFMYLYTRIACNCRSISSREAVKKHFPGHYIQSWRKFQDFQELAPGLKYFSRKNRIQGLFKTVPTLYFALKKPSNHGTDLHFRVNSIKIFTRLQPRAKSWEFPAAAIKINPGYFHRKHTKNRAKKTFQLFNSLSTNFRYPATWNLSVLIIIIIIIIIIFTLGIIYSTTGSGAEQMPEANNYSNRTKQG